MFYLADLPSRLLVLVVIAFAVWLGLLLTFRRLPSPVACLLAASTTAIVTATRAGHVPEPIAVRRVAIRGDAGARRRPTAPTCSPGPS